jgi:hypothetical protein
VSFLTTILSIILGYSAGNILFSFTIGIFDIDPTKIYWIIIVVCVMICLILSGFIEKFIFSLVTSLIGAYCAVRGLSIVLGGFPDEKYLFTLLTHRELNQVSRIFAGPAFIYLFTLIMIFVLGILFQSGIITHFSLSNEKENDINNIKEITPNEKNEK